MENISEIKDEVKYLLDQYEINLEELIRKTGHREISENIVLEYVREKYFPKVKMYKKLDPIRKIASRKLSTSYKSAVHVTVFKTINVEPLLHYKEILKSTLGEKISFTFMLLKPLARVLKDSVFNSELQDEDKLVVYDDVNIAIAVQTEKGLVTPVIRKVDEKDWRTLFKEYVDLISRARSFKLKQKDIVGATFTISNLGMYGVDYFTQIINPPQTAILGVGKIREDLILTQSKDLKTVKVATFSLTFDHRVADGADAAIFLNKLEDEIIKFKIEE
ncbi:MAG: 2-oxo acid dehydrogenase subunit E2 [Desulfurococcaceae archaeon]